MSFYTSIAKYYDLIFPFKPMQKKFVLNFSESIENGSLLDIGCGTGGLVSSLIGNFDKLVGIDPDKEMLRLAPAKDIIDYLPVGMLDLKKNFAPDTFDVIVCFGNTLVHLGSEEEVNDFVNQAKNLLKPGGKLLVQIINYDRILNQKLGGLPSIENDEICFERYYEYADDPVKIDFKTKLTIKLTGEIIENSVPLLALRPGRLRNIVEDTGYNNIKEYGNFKMDLFTSNSQPYIVSMDV